MRSLSLLSILAAPLLSAQVITVLESGREMRYEISCEELQCHPASGAVAHRIMIPDQETSARTLEFAQNLAEENGNLIDLVLYPQGEKKDKMNRRVATRRILVELAAGASIEQIKGAAGALAASSPDYAPNFLILDFADSGDSFSALTQVRATPGVLSANPLLAKSRKKRFIPNDPRLTYSNSNSRYQWHLKNTGQNGGTAGIDANLESAWDTYLGNGVLIGIVDDGLETAHPDLAPNTNTAIDFNWNDGASDDPSPSSSRDDHGTSCAGVAAARGNNGIGGSGAAPEATLVGLRLIAGSVSDADEAEAMSWRSDLIQIKSNSWGPFDGQGTLDDSGPLVKAAFKSSIETGRGGLGTIHVWAAGNGFSDDNVNYDGYASSIYTIATGAVTDTGARSNYSEPGASKLISAPSSGGNQGITTTTLVQNESYTDDFGGTSSATPLISGVCALILEANPNLGWRDVQEILIQSAVKVSPSDAGWNTNGAGFDFNHEFGAGMVDATAAVALANGWTNLPPQQSILLASGTLNAAIPDDSSAGTSTTFDLTQDDALRVEHVTLTANITHPDRGDLTILLTSPNGTESFLAVPQSDAGANFTNWKMMTVHNWGENSQGVWTLKVSDSVSGQTGTLSNATIELFGAPTAPIVDPPVFSHAASTTGNAESFFSFNLRANNATTSYTATGLPPGLSLNETSGLISGVPTSEGTFSVAVTATNTIGTTNGSVSIEIGPRIPTPPVIASGQSATGITEVPFTYQIESTNSPTSYQINPPLPTGLALDSNGGFISGTTSVGGTTNFTITASNIDGSDTASLSLTFFAPGAGPLPSGLDTSTFIYETSGDGTWVFDNTTGEGGGSVVSTDITDSQSATFSTTLTGPGLAEFRWMVSSEEDFDELIVSLDGVRQSGISGEQDWAPASIIIPAGEHRISWSYQKDFSISAGSDQGRVDALTFTPGNFSRTLEEALDTPGFQWSASGNGPAWTGQIFTTWDGIDAAQAGLTPHSEESILEVTLEGPGTFSFYYQVDSEQGFDFLVFSLDGEEQFSESGQVSWTQHTIEIPAGPHNLRWSYQKDFSVSLGADTAWVDNVSYTSSYQHWSDLHFSATEQADPQIGGTSADPDQDGLSNLLEYAQNSDPLIQNLRIEPALTLLPENVAFDFLVDTFKSDLVYQAQTSHDLESWSPVSSSATETDAGIETRRVISPLTDTELYFRYLLSLEP